MTSTQFETEQEKLNEGHIANLNVQSDIKYK